MSLPSVVSIMAEMNISDSDLTPELADEILEKAIRRDLPLATKYLHDLSHKVNGLEPTIGWIEDPNSPLGKQLIRIHASDAMRRVTSKRICHGKQLAFVNCCKGFIGKPPTEEELAVMQVRTQNGVIASSDC